MYTFIQMKKYITIKYNKIIKKQYDLPGNTKEQIINVTNNIFYFKLIKPI